MSLGSFFSPNLFTSKTTTQFSSTGGVCSREGKGWRSRAAGGQGWRVLPELHGGAWCNFSAAQAWQLACSAEGAGGKFVSWCLLTLWLWVCDGLWQQAAGLLLVANIEVMLLDCRGGKQLMDKWLHMLSMQMFLCVWMVDINGFSEWEGMMLRQGSKYLSVKRAENIIERSKK